MAETFIRKCHIEAPQKVLHDWHHAKSVFHRIQPPWESAKIVNKADSISNGLEEHIQIQMGPLKQLWIARYQNVIAGKQFCDLQVKGPFKYWLHEHKFHDNTDDSSTLEDNISYSPPLGSIGQFLAGGMVRKKLDMMFKYRHFVTKEDIKRHHLTKTENKKILITGGTGLVGSQLTPLLESIGHEVFLLTRNPTAENHIKWSYKNQEIETEKLAEIDTVINLAGASISLPWTSKNKKEIYESRVRGSQFLIKAISNHCPKLQTYLSASGSGIYPLNSSQKYDETGPAGNTFLGKMAQEWEATAKPLEKRGVRVAYFRIGVVMSSLGGALQKMLTPAKLCLTGPWGNGKQHMSWIAIDDLTDILCYAVNDENYQGPINTVAKESVTVNQFFKTLGHVLKRPQLFRVPAFALKALPGGMGREIFLGDNNVEPKVLNKLSYQYRHSSLESALRLQLGLFKE